MKNNHKKIILLIEDEPITAAITVKVSFKDNQGLIIVQDNGVRIPESVNFENANGFGMQLIALLVNQIHGTVKIERQDGTRFVIEFALK